MDLTLVTPDGGLDLPDGQICKMVLEHAIEGLAERGVETISTARARPDLEHPIPFHHAFVTQESFAK